MGLEPTTHCSLGRCSTTELRRQLNGWVESRQYKARATSLTHHQGVDGVIKRAKLIASSQLANWNQNDWMIIKIRSECYMFSCEECKKAVDEITT